ncbi:MAG: gliding motility-associated ABC transporter ATP-binding subunit GldA [Bacteroidales bacterium]|nr:gliding motility-associated ABC transporter ATP-binding subunit GldA [Bacteroidales bacterium]
MSISVQNITKIYGEQNALDNVSLNIETGEVVGLLGPNGAGKSTMMKIITCFLPPNQGSVMVDGFDVMQDSIEVRKLVGYLPEHNPLYLDMYVKEYLEFVAGIYKIDQKWKRVMEMIDITGLALEQNKKIGALSKGYRQRVGLAQAMIHDPKILILDEPTSGLDPNQLVDIRNLIKEIGKEKTIMLSTHIMQEVEAMCDRVVIIDRGRIVADDTTSNISAKTSGKLIIKVEFDKVVDAKLLAAIPGVTQLDDMGENIWKLESNQDQDLRSDVFQFAVDHKIKVLAMAKEELKLEDIFHALTKK